MPNTSRKYNIEHRKVRKTSFLYEEQLSWIKRNQPEGIKSESEFISLLLSLGIQQFQREQIESMSIPTETEDPCQILLG